MVFVLCVALHLADLDARVGVVSEWIGFVVGLLVANGFLDLSFMGLFFGVLRGLIKRLGPHSNGLSFRNLKLVVVFLFNFPDHQSVSWFAVGSFAFFVRGLHIEGVLGVPKVVTQLDVNKTCLLSGRSLIAVFG